jgi:hypothetical protein
MAVSMTVYLICLRAMRLPQARLSKLFAAAAIAIYYWFRIPMLFGVGRFGLDGSLTGLVGSLPTPAIIALQVAVVALIVVWLARGLIAAAPWMNMHPVSINPSESPAR